MYLWLIHVDVWQKPTQYYKAIILQLKINNFLKNEVKFQLTYEAKKKEKKNLSTFSLQIAEEERHCINDRNIISQ